MHDRLMLGKYYPGKSIMHRLDPRTKLILLILLMVTLLIPKTILPILLLFIGSVGLIIISKIPLKEILSSLRSIMFILVFAFLINLFSGKGPIILDLGILKITQDGLLNAILMSVRLILLVIDTTLFLTLTTTPLQLSHALENLLKPLSVIRFPAHEIAMMMSIALRFVPTLFEETDKIMKAQSSRGANYDVGGFFNKIKGYISIIVPLFISCFRRADELANAMEARCYHGGKGRTKLNELRYTTLDLLFSLIFIICCVIILFTHYQMPNLI
ncbi:MAG TPA: energy-coupling factor transporter transmembrane protein EcfT [Clostridiaceae bacterium]|nr:energy-coupling factor transporter transmembrane protein EcfT [Clostridiaceae bacterium]